MSDIVVITEKYISPKVLSKESSFSWIKWIPGTVFDKLILRYEADVDITQLFNVNNKVFEIPCERKGQLIIPREMLQMDGFFGFASSYTEISDNERPVSYEIDLISNGVTQTIHLEHMVTRPLLKVVKSSPESIQLSKFSVLAQPFSVELKSLGTAIIHDLTYVIDVQTKDDLKIEIFSSEKAKDTQLFDTMSSSQKISVKGKGYGLIRMSAEYKDVFGTKYVTLIRDIPIHAEEIQNQSFPIIENLEKHKAQLLTASR